MSEVTDVTAELDGIVSSKSITVAFLLLSNLCTNLCISSKRLSSFF